MSLDALSDEDFLRLGAMARAADDICKCISGHFEEGDVGRLHEIRAEVRRRVMAAFSPTRPVFHFAWSNLFCDVTPVGEWGVEQMHAACRGLFMRRQVEIDRFLASRPKVGSVVVFSSDTPHPDGGFHQLVIVRTE